MFDYILGYIRAGEILQTHFVIQILSNTYTNSHTPSCCGCSCSVRIRGYYCTQGPWKM